MFFQIFVSIVVFCLYICVSFFIGIAATKIFKIKNGIIEKIIIGFFIYNVLFAVYVLPLKFKLFPVDIIGYIWFSFVLVFMIVCAVLYKRDIIFELQEEHKYIKKHRSSVSVLVVYIICLVAFYEIYGRINAGYNETWFTGWTSIGVYYNELMTHSVDSGLPIKMFENNRVWCTSLDHSAVVCKLTGLHPIIEARTVLGALFLVFQILIIWEIAKTVSPKNDKKMMVAFAIGCSIKHIEIGSYYLPEYYAFFRSFEGKGMVMSVAVPFLLLMLWKMYDLPSNRTYVFQASAVLMGAMTYSFSTMFSMPFLLAAYSPFVISKKDKVLFKSYLLLCAISFAYFVLYMCGDKGIIDLTIKR